MYIDEVGDFENDHNNNNNRDNEGNIGGAAAGNNEANAGQRENVGGIVGGRHTNQQIQIMQSQLVALRGNINDLSRDMNNDRV